jgi:XRE family aerobic/anaerobic benzoate catabolism transcriptional regulator
VSRRAKARKAVPENGLQQLSPAKFLEVLGARVRDARARHGMTRPMLARDSKISLRYLAELESGRGNFSIVLLRRVADAIHVKLAELLDDELPSPVEYTLLLERARRLNPSELREAAELMAERFGKRSDRVDRIALIGLRGAGKSTLGAMLAHNLGWRFVELSREIEAEAGVRVDEIFDLWGQAAYRRYERRALERVMRGRRKVVLATAGGLVSEPATFDLLLESFYTVWLRASPQEHWDRVISQGDHRVKGSGDDEALADMQRILTQREALYGNADAQLNTGAKTVKESLRDLLTLIRARIVPDPLADGGAPDTFAPRA